MKGMLVLLLLFSVPLHAYAAKKQCEELTAKQARLTYALLMKERVKSSIFVVDRYCEFCNDMYPKPILVDTLNIVLDELGSKKGSSIYLNGKKMDLAYYFLNGDNLALKVNCPTIAVSKYL